jgi:hypothetical protein
VNLHDFIRHTKTILTNKSLNNPDALMMELASPSTPRVALDDDDLLIDGARKLMNSNLRGKEILQLRPGQLSSVKAALHNDVLAVLPTNYGMILNCLF